MTKECNMLCKILHLLLLVPKDPPRLMTDRPSESPPNSTPAEAASFTQVSDHLDPALLVSDTSCTVRVSSLITRVQQMEAGTRAALKDGTGKDARV